jgi:hypothetical protein
LLVHSTFQQRDPLFDLQGARQAWLLESGLAARFYIVVEAWFVPLA